MQIIKIYRLKNVYSFYTNLLASNIFKCKASIFKTKSILVVSILDFVLKLTFYVFRDIIKLNKMQLSVFIVDFSRISASRSIKDSYTLARNL
jgi:hypothetical protein